MLKIIPVNSAWHIIDTTTPGGRTVEQHSRREIAERRLVALRPVPAAAEPALDTDAWLSRKVSEIRSSVGSLERPEDVEALMRAERVDRERSTVLAALESRLAALLPQ